MGRCWGERKGEGWPDRPRLGPNITSPLGATTTAMLIFLPPPSSFLNPTPPSHLYSFYLPVSLSYSPSEHLCLLASLVVCPFPVPSLLFVTSISLSWCVPYLQSLLCPLCPRLSICPIPPHPETFPFCCQPSLLILLSPPKNAFYALLQTNEMYLYLF